MVDTIGDLNLFRRMARLKAMHEDEGVRNARDYYNSSSAEGFYSTFWGGEDLHIGIYEEQEESIREASRRTVARMAEGVPLSPNARVLDVGAGYGGSARYLSGTFGCQTVCLNLSEVQNERNRRLTREQGLERLLSVVEGNFEELPFEDESFDVVWSQDAMLHSGRRERILSEVARVLRDGGYFIFTDPMQSDDADPEVLEPVLERLDLESLASPRFYRERAASSGLIERSFEDLSSHLTTHYGRVLNELLANDELARSVSGEEYVERMMRGLRNWVRAGEAGALTWGMFRFQKGEAK